MEMASGNLTDLPEATRILPYAPLFFFKYAGTWILPVLRCLHHAPASLVSKAS